MNYFPLHVHSHYSLLDGLSKPNQIARRCQTLGLRGSALTDHGTISGAMKFQSAMKNRNLQSIIGCEFYLCPHDPTDRTIKDRTHSHLCVLAKNFQGWLQLVQLSSLSNSKAYFYYKPRLNLSDFENIENKELVAFSGHMGSDLANVIFKDPNSAYNAKSIEEVKQHVIDKWHIKAVDLARKYEKIFGRGNFFLEIQLIDVENLPASRIIADGLRWVSKKTGIPCVATPDAHYPSPEDASDQRVLLSAKIDCSLPDIEGKLISGENVGLESFFRSNAYHIPSPERMQELHTPEELDNTLKIAEMCSDYDLLHKPRLPKFTTPNNESSDEYLKKLCREGWKKRLPEIKHIINTTEYTIDTYIERFNEEFKILTEVGLSDYFLIVYDLIRFAVDDGQMVGAGRGSAAGSLILYLLGVTHVDPIEYDLLFSRFYNKGRNTADHVSLPDVDMDFEKNGREKVLEYVREKYGHEQVAQMLTFGRMQGKLALKEVMRAHNVGTFKERNEITKYIPDEADISDQLEIIKEADKKAGGDGEASILHWALENGSKDLKKHAHIDENGKIQGPYAKIFEQAIRIEGTKKNTGKHAAGIVISEVPLHEICPMVYDKSTGEVIAGMEMDDLEAAGHIKFDFLGLKTLDCIHNAISLLREGRIYY